MENEFFPLLLPKQVKVLIHIFKESNDIKIKSMEDEIEQILSLRKPKKIMLKSESGRYYHYLCKKDDDLRKDMRMMETASFINRILANDRRCRQRGLSIITYAVICFNETCGMMEWVENTKSFRKTIETMLKYRNISINYGTLKELYISKDKLDEKEMAIRRSNFKKKFYQCFHLSSTAGFLITLKMFLVGLNHDCFTQGLLLFGL